MDFPNYFADAETSFSDAEIVIFGVPFEKTSSFRHGADKAPFEIRQASWNFERYDLKTGVNFEQIPLHDYGDLDVSAHRSKELFEHTKQHTTMLLNKKKTPVAIGGDHSITPGIVSAFPANIAVLSLDAHIDFRQQYKNDPYNHACVIRRIADHVPIKNIAVLGIRSAEQEELQEAKDQHLFFRDAYEIKRKGLDSVIADTKRILRDKPLYLTIDIDVVDPAFAPGTSTPEPFGLSGLEISDIIEAFSTQLIGCDLVEVCPPYDHGQTAVLAAKLLRSCINGMWSNKERLG